jgi:hypothetical protein
MSAIVPLLNNRDKIGPRSAWSETTSRGGIRESTES